MSTPTNDLTAADRIVEAGRSLLLHVNRCFRIEGREPPGFDFAFDRKNGGRLADALLALLGLASLPDFLASPRKRMHGAAYNIAHWCRFERTADDPPDFKIDVLFRSTDAERIDDSSVPPLEGQYVMMLESALEEFEAAIPVAGKPASATAAKGKSKATYLGHGKLRIDGEILSVEPERQATLEAIVELGSATTAELIERSRVEHPDRVMRGLKKHPTIGPHIKTPGTRGMGGYSTTIKDGRRKR